MIIPIDGLDVCWPYPYVYKEQHSYMTELKRTLDAKGHCLLEMPSGTGKTISLLALIVSYMKVNPHAVRKLVYCTRTVPEIEKVLEEMKALLAYREKVLGKEGAGSFLCVGLSARKNLCINPAVSQYNSRNKVDSACHDRIASFVREQAVTNSDIELCSYFEEYERNKDMLYPPGVYALHDLRQMGEEKGMCPYFMARRLIPQANIVVYAYPYMLDARISHLVAQEMTRDSCVVFDEAHNIDNACIESMSVRLTKNMLEAATSNLNKLSTSVQHARASGSERLRTEYDRLLAGLRMSKTNPDADKEDDAVSNPALPPEAIEEAIPGNIRKAEYFVQFMKRFVEHLKSRLLVQHVVHDTPLVFRQTLLEKTHIEDKPLRFCSERLSSLMYTLQMSHTEEFYPLTLVAQFAVLVGTHTKGFAVLIEPIDERTQIRKPVIQLRCLDSSLALKPIFERFNSVIITSGTLSPLDMYPKILDFRPVSVVSLPMTLTRNCLCPLVITRGSDQIAISTKYDMRADASVVRNFGLLIVEMASVVPDGIVCFFTSYSYMEEVIGLWHAGGVIHDILQHKLVFIETPDTIETSLALENFKRACDCGRGAVLLSVARGKVSEGIDFSHQYGRCVIMFGIPFMHTESRSLRARLEFLRDQYDVKEGDFLTFDAMRTAAQCLGRCIRTKSDYGIMILADKRYNRMDKRNKLPRWISQAMPDSHLNLSSDMGVSIARQFLKEMAQPLTKEEQLGNSLLSEEHVQALAQGLPLPAPPSAVLQFQREAQRTVAAITGIPVAETTDDMEGVEVVEPRFLDNPAVSQTAPLNTAKRVKTVLREPSDL